MALSHWLISLVTFVDPNCSSVKYILKGTSASVYQFGSGRVFCNVTIRTDPGVRIRLYAEFFNTGLFLVVLLILVHFSAHFLPSTDRSVVNSMKFQVVSINWSDEVTDFGNTWEVAFVCTISLTLFSLI